MIEARRVPADTPDALTLLEATVAEIVAMYAELDLGRTPTAEPHELSAPHGAYVVLYEQGRPVAGGGVKRFGDDVAEIKRMYVVPEARGRGLARRLLSELEGAARDLGYSLVRLDTGPKQTYAERLYRSAGYREIGNYNDNDAASFWGEKAL